MPSSISPHCGNCRQGQRGSSVHSRRTQHFVEVWIEESETPGDLHCSPIFKPLFQKIIWTGMRELEPVFRNISVCRIHGICLKTTSGRKRLRLVRQTLPQSGSQAISISAIFFFSQISRRNKNPIPKALLNGTIP